MKIGVVAFSFASRDREPSPCNKKLAKETKRIVDKMIQKGHEPVIVAQWEVASALDKNKLAHVVTRHQEEGKYLDSEEVFAQAEEIFTRQDIRIVVVVAQPFLYITKCRQLVTDSGFLVKKDKVNWIGFDKKSNQPWTRSLISLFLYTLKQKIFGHRGF